MLHFSTLRDDDDDDEWVTTALPPAVRYCRSRHFSFYLFLFGYSCSSWIDLDSTTMFSPGRNYSGACINFSGTDPTVVNRISQPTATGYFDFIRANNFNLLGTVSALNFSTPDDVQSFFLSFLFQSYSAKGPRFAPSPSGHLRACSPGLDGFSDPGITGAFNFAQFSIFFTFFLLTER